MHWIRLIYAQQTAEIWINGSKSSKIMIGQGVQQGGPLLPLLFNIMIEILALAMCQQQEIKGILTKSLEHKT